MNDDDIARMNNEAEDLRRTLVRLMRANSLLRYHKDCLSWVVFGLACLVVVFFTLWQVAL